MGFEEKREAVPPAIDEVEAFEIDILSFMSYPHLYQKDE
ncbi:unnamed protein product [Brugia timori]|uniref:Pyruvate dehydrogenase E1 component subunit beta n=1 Tax=Brugia timori TaxID=42155 RepID=A0A0R3QDA8_9BILA|nr:unnamed protein product [Brugia timori]